MAEVAHDLQQSVKQLRKALLSLSMKLDDVREAVTSSTPAKASPAGFELLADTIDGLRRLEETLRPAHSRAEPRSLWARLFGRPVAPPAGLQDAADGVTLLKERILDALAAEGVGPITASGIFDSELHQVAGTEPGSQPGEILRTIRAGYTQRGRVLRPALVVVAAQD